MSGVEVLSRDASPRRQRNSTERAKAHGAAVGLRFKVFVSAQDFASDEIYVTANNSNIVIAIMMPTPKIHRGVCFVRPNMMKIHPIATDSSTVATIIAGMMIVSTVTIVIGIPHASATSRMAGIAVLATLT